MIRADDAAIKKEIARICPAPLKPATLLWLADENDRDAAAAPHVNDIDRLDRQTRACRKA